MIANRDVAELEVQAYQPVTLRLWNNMRGAVRRRTIGGGHNTRVDYMPGCSIVHFDPPEPRWLHSWRTTLPGARAAIRSGLVNGFEPTIGGVPLSGTERERAPYLSLSLGLYDAEGRSWIAIRSVRLGDELAAVDKLDPKQLTIVQVAEIPGLAGGGVLDVDGVALWPIALLKRRADQPRDFGKVHQIVHFDLTHRYSVASQRHFFFSA